MGDEVFLFPREKGTGDEVFLFPGRSIWVAKNKESMQI
jgi:hypothetical protein